MKILKEIHRLRCCSPAFWLKPRKAAPLERTTVRGTNARRMSEQRAALAAFANLTEYSA